MKKLHGQSGTSLIEALIGIAITAMVALTIATMLNNAKRGESSVRQAIDLEAIKTMLRDGIDCSASIPISGCKPGQLMSVYRKASGTPTSWLAGSGSGTKMAGWTIRAECNATGSGLILRAARLAPSGNLNSTSANDFLADPLTGKVRTWVNSASLLFGSGVELCAIAPCQAGERPLMIGAQTQCVNIASLCSAMGSSYNASTQKCIPNMQEGFGGLYQRGEKNYYGPNCETPNPRTNACSCPPGFTDIAMNPTGEPNGEWDEDHFCFRW